jgi:hypothetical protein
VTETIADILAACYFLGLAFWMAPKSWREIRRPKQ